jgi:hypothetical protein
MNAHPMQDCPKLDSAPGLIEAATRTYSRLNRVAIHATPTMRLRLAAELALVENVLDSVENAINAAARAALKAVPRQHALPGTRRALPAAKRRRTP